MRLKALFVVASLFFVLMAQAQSRLGSATCAEAKALAEKASFHLKKQGLKKALKDFYAPPFVDRDLYVFVYSPEGTIIMHQASPEIEGLYSLDSKDIMGRYIDRRLMKVEKTGWVSYMFNDPTRDNAIRHKKTYVINVNGYRICVGCYGKQALE